MMLSQVKFHVQLLRGSLPMQIVTTYSSPFDTPFLMGKEHAFRQQNYLDPEKGAPLEGSLFLNYHDFRKTQCFVFWKSDTGRLLTIHRCSKVQRVCVRQVACTAVLCLRGRASQPVSQQVFLLVRHLALPRQHQQAGVALRRSCRSSDGISTHRLHSANNCFAYDAGRVRV